MLLITGSATVDPAHRDEALELTRSTAAATREEAGCLDSRFSVDVADETTFYVFEVWESMAALRAHFGTDHMVRFRSELPPLLEGDLDLAMYEVTETYSTDGSELL